MSAGLSAVKNIPANATECVFQYGRNMSGKFHVWPVKGGKYQWDAMGNCGQANSEKEAIDQAREYILHDYDPLVQQ